MKNEEKEEIVEKRSYKKLIIVILIIISVISGLLLYMRFVSTAGLVIKEYGINDKSIPSEFDGFKIVHFSDLHYNTTHGKKELTKIVKKINNLRADIVVFTGDLLDDRIDITKKDKEDLSKLLNDIECKLFKYGISGNHDYLDDDIDEIFINGGFKYLRNEFEDIYLDGMDPIRIYGFPSSIKDVPDYTVYEGDKDIYSIVLIHEPDSLDEIIDFNPDLVFAGHSHGGQVRVPFFGALYTPVGSKKYYDEYYKVKNTEMFISSGIGTSRMKFRFMNKPSINLYRIYK